MPGPLTIEARVTVDPRDWLLPAAKGTDGRRLRAVFAALESRGISQTAILDALRAAYWAARHSLVTGVEARARRALQRRVACLAKAEDAITAVLDLEEPVSAELAGHLHVARARIRLAARDVRAVEAGPRGRPQGWHRAAERVLLGLGLRRTEARVLLARIDRLIEAGPVSLREVPRLRVAFRAPEPMRKAILERLPLPTARK